MSSFSFLNRMSEQQPTIGVNRSRFVIPHGHHLTMNSGDLVPVLCQEILPGDTVKIRMSEVLRSLTPAVPVMDNSKLDIFAFFVPSRLCTQHEKDWQQVFGENIGGFWANESDESLTTTGNFVSIDNGYLDAYVNPSPSNQGISFQSARCYLGEKAGVTADIYPGAVSTLPHVGLIKIFNEYFRDENTQEPCPIDLKAEVPAYLKRHVFPKANAQFKPSVGTLLGSGCLPVNKLHDMFTDCLPSPQKSPNGKSVLIPLLGSAPVLTSTTEIDTNNKPSLKFKDTGNMIVGNGAVEMFNGQLNTYQGSGSGKPHQTMVPSNLYADLSQASGATINQLRMAFAIQGILENDARSGTRYQEYLMSNFGCSIPAGVAQLPEYLGGHSLMLNVSQVLSTNANAEDPIGTTGAFSNSSGSGNLFPRKSFSEYGYLYVLCCIRTSLSYSQGIDRMFLRDTRYDFYTPFLANIGEQPIYDVELYCNSNSSTKDTDGEFEIFGYQEAWVHFRKKPNRVSGFLAVDADEQLLTPYTYQVAFAEVPVNNSDFKVQDRSIMDDTLVGGSVSPYQFICDFYFEMDFVRPMPLFSIPALLGRF